MLHPPPSPFPRSGQHLPPRSTLEMGEKEVVVEVEQTKRGPTTSSGSWWAGGAWESHSKLAWRKRCPPGTTTWAATAASTRKARRCTLWKLSVAWLGVVFPCSQSPFQCGWKSSEPRWHFSIYEADMKPVPFPRLNNTGHSGNETAYCELFT